MTSSAAGMMIACAEMPRDCGRSGSADSSGTICRCGLGPPVGFCGGSEVEEAIVMSSLDGPQALRLQIKMRYHGEELFATDKDDGHR